MNYSIRHGEILAVILILCLIPVLAAVPARGAVQVTGDLLREFTLEPGESYEGEIIVTNPGEEPTGLQVSKTDYLYFADGSNEYPEPGSIDRSNADWVDFSLPPEVTIEPGEEFPLIFEIAVPSDPSLVGSYWSMITIQSTPPPADEPEEGIGVREVVRYGIQLAVNIGDTGERKIDLLEVKPLVGEENKAVQVNVENVGQRAVSPVARVELYDQEGEKYGPFEGSEYMIYPGCSVSYRVPVEEVPDEEFQGVIIIDNGDQHVWGARKEINFTSSDSSSEED